MNIKMFLMILAVLLVFVPPSFASTSNQYYSPELKYSLQFPGGWSVLKDDEKNQVSPDDQEHTVEVFLKGYGEVQMYLNHLPKDDPKQGSFDELLSYAKESKESEPDFSKPLKKIQTQLGFRVDSVHPDTKRQTIGLIGSQTSSTFGKVTEFIQWQRVDDVLVELHFFVIEDVTQSMDDISSITRSFSASSTKKDTSLEEGSFNYDKNKVTTSNSNREERQKSPLWNFLMKFSNPLYWGVGVGLFLLWTIAYHVLKRY